MSWVILSILAAVIFAFVNIIDKYLVTKLIRNPIIPVIIVGAIGFLLGIGIFLFNGFKTLSVINTLLAVIAGNIHMLASVLYFWAIKREEVSRIIPIIYLQPLFIAILASLFLGELFGPLTYVGIAAMILGAVLISIKLPFEIRFGKAFWMAISAAALWSLHNVIVKHLLEFTDFWTAFSYTRVGTIIFFAALLYIYFQDLKPLLTKKGSFPLLLSSFNETLTFFAMLLVLAAASIGFITLVSTIVSIQPFFILLLTVFLSMLFPKILKEEIDRKTIILKFVAITFIFAGVFLIT